MNLEISDLDLICVRASLRYTMQCIKEGGLKAERTEKPVDQEAIDKIVKSFHDVLDRLPVVRVT